MKTLIALLVISSAGLAADVSGKWRADSTFPRGMKVTEYLELKLEGARVSGIFVDAFGGRKEIKDGKLAGDRVSFWIDWDKTGKCEAEGVLRAGALELVLVTKSSRRAITARKE
jgi:hypothetical protein